MKRLKPNFHTHSLCSLENALRECHTHQQIGKVCKANGTNLSVTGLSPKMGELCLLYNHADEMPQEAEVIGLQDSSALLTPLGNLNGISTQTRVIATGRCPTVNVSAALLGQVLDACGNPLVSNKRLAPGAETSIYARPPSPLQRKPVDAVFSTGVRTMDSLLTTGEGQRLGIFAAAGTGKSTLLSMLARNSEADVNVIALIGERGREVNEFVCDHLAHSLEKSVVVVATSDRPALERVRANYVAMTIAEYFRDQGAKVLLLVDSVTRFARALRDVGLCAGEPPIRRGFPSSVFSVLPQIMERAGMNAIGSITAFYTVLIEDEAMPDPIAEEVKSILDGHIHLSRNLASKNHFPPIDVLNSISRLMNRVVTQEHAALAAKARQLLAKYEEVELLIQVGEYQSAQDELADEAIASHSKLQDHMVQTLNDLSEFSQSVNSLKSALV